MKKRLQENNRYSLIIVGGGASGLAAACVAANSGIDALIIEKNNKLGKKLLATGNGRCNILNSGTAKYFGEYAFAEQVLKNCGYKKLCSFFESLGLVLRQEEYGRVYPAANRSDVVLSCLNKKIENSAVKIHLEETVIKISPADDMWKVDTDKGIYYCDYLLLCLGSPASPKLGGCDSAKKLLMPLGFNFFPYRPALCPVNCNMGRYKSLKGLRLFARCTLANAKNGALCAASTGEVLFADYGLSGVCIMQLSGFIDEKNEYCIYLDLSPNFEKALPKMQLSDPIKIDANTHKAERFLKNRSGILNKNEILLGALPNRLAKLLTGKTIHQTAVNVTQLKFPVKSLRGFDFAQTASGGIDIKNINPANMQSYYKNLYLAGEMLNVFGDCGGFNLMFAFACGILAAEDIAGKTNCKVPAGNL